ncbi:Uncharacterised protein [uncultured archaeon]|nr:Uncharacterised protein [uncultured archaeon]
MELLTKVIVSAVVMIVLLLGAYYLVRQSTMFQHVTAAQAGALVTDDLLIWYPNSNVTITNLVPSNYSGSWHVVASVITNETTPCPSFYIFSFDYPKFNLVNRPENTYVADCSVNGWMPGRNFTISSFPVAIALSYSSGIPSVTHYVQSVGFRNVTVNATFFSALGVASQNNSAISTLYPNVWRVGYSSQRSANSLYVILSQKNASIMGTINYSNTLSK